MRRSKTTFEPSSPSRVNGLLGTGLEAMSLSVTVSPLGQNRRVGNGNASWGSTTSQTRDMPYVKRGHNIFLQDNTDINNLLGRLRTNEFSGQFVKEHHSNYLNEPKIEAPVKKPRRLGESYHRSDGHLLRLQSKQTPLQSIQAL